LNAVTTMQSGDDTPLAKPANPNISTISTETAWSHLERLQTQTRECLEWLIDRYILVQRSFRHGRLTNTIKVRRVDMSDQLSVTLQELLNKRKLEGLAEGKGAP